MSISPDSFNLSLKAINEYKEHAKNKIDKYRYSLRIKEDNGEKYLVCYDTTNPDHIKDIPWLDRISGFFLCGNTHTSNVNEFWEKYFPFDVTDLNEIKDPETRETDKSYFKKLNLHSRMDFKKLESAYLKRNEKSGSIENFMRKLKSFAYEIFKKTTFNKFFEEYNELMMTQENLVNDGTYNFIQRDIFLDLIKSEDADEFANLRKGLEKMHSLEGNVLKSYLLLGQNDFIAERMFADFQALDTQENNNMWIDLASCPGKHSMKGRIERISENDYRFQMSNTGAGINKYPELHKVGKREGKEVYQTVVEWKFKNEDLNIDFFKKILDATVFGNFNGEKPKVDENEKGQFGEDIGPIKAIYSVILEQFPLDRHPPLDKDINSSYWSSEQIGPSCVPYSIWSLARVVLSPNQYEALRTSARIRYFQKNYHKIATKQDKSIYSLLQASEQVNALLAEAEKVGKSSKLLQRIREDLSSRNGLAEKTVLNDSPFKWEPLPNEVITRKAELVKNGNSKVKVDFEKYKDNDDAFKLQIEKDSNGEPTGLATLSYLLYEAILSGNNEIIENYIEKFKNFITNNPDPSKINLNIDIDSLNRLSYLFYHLAASFQEVDGTISSRSKQLQLVNIAETLHMVLFNKIINDPNYDNSNNENSDKNFLIRLGKDLQERMQSAIEFYRIADTSKYLDENNFWRQQSKDLRPWEYSDLWIANHKRNHFLTNGFVERKLCNISLDNQNLDVIDRNIPLKAFIFTNPDELNDSSLKVKIGALPKELEHYSFIQSDLLEGKAYLVYRYLYTGEREKLNEALNELIKDLNGEISKVNHLDLLKWIATSLKNSSDSLNQLDNSQEAIALQHSLYLVSSSLFNYMINKSNELNLSEKEKTEVIEKMEQIKNRLPYYNAINATAFFDSRNPIKIILRQSQKLFNKWNVVK